MVLDEFLSFRISGRVWICPQREIGRTLSECTQPKRGRVLVRCHEREDRRGGHFPGTMRIGPSDSALIAGCWMAGPTPQPLRLQKISKNSFVDYQRLTQIRSKFKKPPAALFRTYFNVKDFVSPWASTTFRQTIFRPWPPLYMRAQFFQCGPSLGFSASGLSVSFGFWPSSFGFH